MAVQEFIKQEPGQELQMLPLRDPNLTHSHTSEMCPHDHDFGGWLQIPVNVCDSGAYNSRWERCTEVILETPAPQFNELTPRHTQRQAPCCPSFPEDRTKHAQPGGIWLPCLPSVSHLSREALQTSGRAHLMSLGHPGHIWWGGGSPSGPDTPAFPLPCLCLLLELLLSLVKTFQ
jgi:hypothetical protein